MKLLSFVAASLLGLASAFACPAGTTATSETINGKPICILGDSEDGIKNYLNAEMVLTADHAYVLKGEVRIGGDNKDNSTLTIQPGTVVYGVNKSFLTITRGSKIFVNGSENQPVVFTSRNVQSPTTGDWGGLVVIGNAVINTCTDKGSLGYCQAAIEGVSAGEASQYGGSNDDDNSGSIKYLRVEYAGSQFSADNELNSISFYSVGRGTLVEYIEAYKGFDDGVEVFGGAVNLKYVVSIDSGDDGFDWDNGWRGAAQFVYVQMENVNSKDPNGIEADNLKKPQDASPRSNPILSNVTIVAKGSNALMLNGIQLRRGTGAQIYNTLVKGTFKNCFNIDDSETFKKGGISAGAVQEGLVVQNSILQCESAIEVTPEDVWSISDWLNEVIEFDGTSRTKNYVVATTEKILENDLMPLVDSLAMDTGMLPPDMVFPGDFEFEAVDYIGAFSPDASDWTEGWTVK